MIPSGVSPVAQVTNLLPMQEMQETWVRSLSWEDLPGKEMVIHYSILAWKNPGTEKPGVPKGSQRIRFYWAHAGLEWSPLSQWVL